MRLIRFIVATALGMIAAERSTACTISAPGVAFGAYDPRSAAPNDGAGTIIVSCPPRVTAPVVQLGTGISGSFAARRMVSGAWTLDYNLYSNSGRTVTWGDGTGGTVTQTLSGGIVLAGQRRFARTVYGRIAAGQNVGVGSYGDTVFVTIVF